MYSRKTIISAAHPIIHATVENILLYTFTVVALIPHEIYGARLSERKSRAEFLFCGFFKLVCIPYARHKQIS